MQSRSRHRKLTLFVTVGSTRFDALINKILSDKIVKQLTELGIKRLICQVGKSDYKSEKVKELIDGHKIDIEVYDYKKSIQEDIAAADVVVGHAGAGTCLEVLRAGKRLLIVVNETLMDNHQDELADELSGQNYLLKSRVEDLSTSLECICDFKRNFSTFPAPSRQFERILDEALEKLESR